MSLFGTSPDESTTAGSISKSRLSLFDDELSLPAGSKSSLFADDDNTPGTSPWGIPTPRKAPRSELIKNLLSVSDVPNSYVSFFDHVLNDGYNDGGKINSSGIAKVLSAGGLSADDQTKIMSIIAPSGQVSKLGRNEFNVFLALIGLAQEKEEISLDGVDERRRNLPLALIGLVQEGEIILDGMDESRPNLPIPKLPSFSTTVPTVTPSLVQQAAKPIQRSRAISQNESVRPQSVPKDSLIDPEADPWGSLAMHKGHNHDSLPKANGTPRSGINGFHEPVRTTSTFTSTSAEGSTSTPNRPAQDATTTDSIWGSYGAGSSAAFNNPISSGLGAGGFGGGPGGNDQGRPAPSPQTRAIGGGQVNRGAEETIQIQLLPEKEGMFLFQHHNYHVISVRRGSKVVRRYSDFVWLLDCLHKRFPFRQLPLLPPKRVGVNGNHLAADSTFIEKRRRGLTRFSNALMRHPVLSQEQLVIMFLTVPTELAVWRKQATISVQEEFQGRALSPGLEDSLPPSLNDLFERSRSGIRRSAEIYINLCNLLDRMAKRKEGLAADHLRLSLSLRSLTDATHDTYATDSGDVPLLNEGLQATAKHLSNSQALLEDEARAWDAGILEDLKRQRDTLVSMRDLFDRRDRYDTDNIPYLERRIQTNENKLTALRARTEGLVKPGEIEKVTEAIIKDKQSIVTQHSRGVFVKECVRDELIFFQQSQYHVSHWNQDWAQERVKYSELHADNWKQLQDELESMPLGE